jgi:RHS repeat-associated protein
MNVEYVIGDDLGSTSITTDVAGNKISEMRYTPWGEVRYTWTNAPVDIAPTYELLKYTFTGQYSYVEEFGLMFYNARFYDPMLGRFTSADSYVSDDNQGFDRYNYVNNRPTISTDPTGNFRTDPGDGGSSSAPSAYQPSCYTGASSASMNLITKHYGGRGRGSGRPRTTYMDTYTIANIGAQNPVMVRPRIDPRADGPAKVLNKQMCTKRKKENGEPYRFGDLIDRTAYLDLCGLDPQDYSVAYIAMSRRIQSAIDHEYKQWGGKSCVGGLCSGTDIFIAAALAGDSGFTYEDLKTVLGYKQAGDANYWVTYLIHDATDTEDAVDYLQDFLNITWELYLMGYPVGDVDWEEVCRIIEEVRNSTDPEAHD